jgi:hypothetical protein
LQEVTLARTAVPKDEKFEKQDFDLFEAITAIDKKDYGYYDRLTPEQQRKFVPFMMLHWISVVKGKRELSQYYLQSVDFHANTYLFNENVIKHPKLQWLMLCAASPGMGKQFHAWIPHIKAGVSKLKDKATPKDIKEYYKKIYPGLSTGDLTELATAFCDQHKRKMYLATKYPNLKFDEVELLSDIITDSEIEQYEKELGN